MARLNLSIPDELNNTLTVSAKILERSKGYVVRKAIKCYLQEMQEDISDAEIALARMNDEHQKLYTSEEFDTILKAKFNV